MTNVFLKVNKDLFKLGLNPTEVLLLAQIIEFNTTTGAFFMSDKALAEMLSVSESTISRAVKRLESKGFIKRDTRNVKGGKTRTITVDMNKIECALTSLNLTVVEEHEELTSLNLMVDNNQNDTCTTVKMTGDNSQNDLIKDNIKDNNIKDNTSITASAVIESSPISASAELGTTKELPIAEVMTREQVLEEFGLSAVAARVPAGFPNTFWIGQKLIKII